jgi:hypothetical protein
MGAIYGSPWQSRIWSRRWRELSACLAIQHYQRGFFILFFAWGVQARSGSGY